MMALSRDQLAVIEGDARIADHHIQTALGYGQRKVLHTLIRRHEAELATYGAVIAQTDAKPSSKGGRPTVTYYLNEEQATLICMFARTPRAAEARRQIIEVFTAWRRGVIEVQAPRADQTDRLEALIARLQELVGGLERDAIAPQTLPLIRQARHLEAVNAVLHELDQMDGLERHATHLPIWPGSHRPRWWRHEELRAFVTAAHRQMPLSVACAQAADRWPEARVSTSALGRYWQRLDQLRRPRAIPLKSKDAA